ncbi:MAG: PKD domain-containing protein, partial [Acidimicrobiia bacterium]|nr:PKD domain-containing protein [Acidimicrobiia bacterium]
HTQLSNEREYTYSISTTNNELAGSLSTGFILTDDPYGDPNPTLIEGKRLLYVSEIAMGRLVESTSEILTAIGNFSTFNGRLDPATTSSAFGTGYDFIEDAAEAIDLALETDPRRVAPGGSSTTLNTVGGSGNLWSSDDLTAAILGADLDLVSLGAHMAHDGLLSALEDFSNTQADLWDTNDAAALASDFEGTIIFSMGCHSGLSVSDVQIGSPRPDFASTFSAAGAVYLAETGFGYGETEVVALGEELMRQFALRLNGSMTVGQADLYASQFHAAQNSSFGAYDEKVIMETTLYGLPFYAVGNATATPAPPPPKATTTDPSTGLTVVSTSIDTVNDGVVNNTGFDRITGQRGDFFTANGKVQVLPFQPIQPKATVDVTQPGLTATDVLITELTSTDIANFPASFARPIVDSTDKEPEISLTGTFPLILPGVNRYLDITGTRTNLVTVLGQYTSGATAGVGTERLFTHVQAQVHYIDSSVPKANRDLARPVVLSANAVDNGTVLNFTAKAVDDAGVITRVLVLYKQVNTNGAWTPLNLVKTAPGGPGAASSWSASVLSLGGDVEYVVQAVDESGRVGVHYNKRAGHQSVQTPLPDPPPPGITIVDDTTGDPVPTISVDDVIVRINGITAADVVLYKVDEGPITPYTGPVTVTGDRLHRFTAYINGQETFVEFLIDTTPPAILIASPVDGTLVTTGTALVADFTCSDAGVGVDTCTATVSGPSGSSVVGDGDPIDTTATGTYTMTVDAVDELGNDSTASVMYEVVDPLTLTVTPLLVPLGSPITATAGFTPSTGHPHTATWTMGDGTTIECPGATSCLDEGAGTSEVTHTYAQTGVYLVTVVVDHDGFGTQTKKSQFVVVYDATGGFVTGGGWFMTPFGAFTPENPLDAEVTGPAEFGFVSKYKKGATVPTGNTVFELVTSGFEFHSTSYDWLVVQGSKAAYKGTGTIDGWSGTYKFRVTIRDADLNDNDQFVDDAFRIQIWTENPDGSVALVVYDNAYGTDPDSEFGGTQPIDGGSIVIHEPPKKGKN